MLSDLEKANYLMLTSLTPVATLTDTKQQSATTSFSTHIAMFSWYLCNRRDARVESHTHAKGMIVRKKLPAKPNRFVLNETENTYRLFSIESALALFSGTAKMSRNRGFRELLLAKQAVLLLLCTLLKRMNFF